MAGLLFGLVPFLIIFWIIKDALGGWEGVACGVCGRYFKGRRVDTRIVDRDGVNVHTYRCDACGFEWIKEEKRPRRNDHGRGGGAF